MTAWQTATVREAAVSLDLYYQCRKLGEGGHCFSKAIYGVSFYHWHEIKINDTSPPTSIRNKCPWSLVYCRLHHVLLSWVLEFQVHTSTCPFVSSHDTMKTKLIWKMFVHALVRISWIFINHFWEEKIIWGVLLVFTSSVPIKTTGGADSRISQTAVSVLGNHVFHHCIQSVVFINGIRKHFNNLMCIKTRQGAELIFSMATPLRTAALCWSALINGPIIPSWCDTAR